MSNLEFHFLKFLVFQKSILLSYKLLSKSIGMCWKAHSKAFIPIYPISVKI